MWYPKMPDKVVVEKLATGSITFAKLGGDTETLIATLNPLVGVICDFFRYMMRLLLATVD